MGCISRCKRHYPENIGLAVRHEGTGCSIGHEMHWPKSMICDIGRERNWLKSIRHKRHWPEIMAHSIICERHLAQEYVACY